jgi:ABC-type uncharacterized transport system permease subunit
VLKADSKNESQGTLKIPTEFILAMPYAATLAALVVGSALGRARSSK